tara:strand:+ start:2747 stop:3451 length:705 start_codon:yes stop_codon:yes gene_type:complete
VKNVDNREIDQFEELASRWWDPEGSFKPLHAINPLRLNYIEEHISLSGKQVLDLGCGGGILAEAMSEKEAHVVGVDAASASIAVAKLHAKEKNTNTTYKHGTAEDLLETHENFFDVVTCMEMLEHVPKPDEIVATCARLVRPGGSLFFSTINRNPRAWLLAIIGAEYVLGLLPRGTHRYDRFIKPSEMNEWTSRVGLKLNGLIGLHYNPISERYHIGPGIEVNYIAHCFRPTES